MDRRIGGTEQTDLEEAQQRLLESQERLRQLAEHIQEVFWLCNPALTELYYISPAYETVWGRSCQSLYDDPKSFLEAVHPHDRAAMTTIVSERLAEGYDIEFRIVRPDGSIRWIRDRAFPIADGSGTVYRIAGIAEDITERKQTEQKFRLQAQILDQVHDSVVSTDPQGYVLTWNRGAERLFGFSASEALGKHISFVYPADQHGFLQRDVIAPLKAKGRHETEVRMRRKSGADFYAHLSLSLLRDREGTVSGMIGYAIDITDRRRAEQMLQDSEERFRRLAENAQDVIFRYGFGAKPGFDYISPAVTAMTGLTPEAYYADPELFLTVVHPEDRPLMARVFQDRTVLGRPLVLRCMHADGTRVWIELRNVPVHDDAGHLVAVEGIARDITDLKRTETELRVRAQQQAVVADLGQRALAGADLSELMHTAVVAAARTLGVEYAKILELLRLDKVLLLRAGVGWQEGCVGHVTVSTGIDSQAGYTLVANEPVIVEDLDTETRFHAPKLLTDHGVQSGISVLIGNRQFPFGILGVHSTERRRFTPDDVHFVQAVANVLATAIETTRDQAKLQEQADLLDHAHDAIIVRDLDDRILFWNQGAARLFGWEASEAFGKKGQELLYRQGAQELRSAWQALLTRGEWRGELNPLNRDGQELIVDSHWTLVRDAGGEPKSVLSINTDVTEKKHVEAQFLRTQRLESIGLLVGGIAHDLGNVLSPILLGVHLLQRQAKDELSQHVLSRIHTSAERGINLIKQVLSFARGAGGKRLLLQPAQVIRDVITLLQQTFPKSIDISMRLADDLWSLEGDVTQLHQLLMNLCVNSRDAMPDGGELHIEATNVSLDEHFASLSTEARPGRFVRVRVTDTGVGIPPDALENIFLPFFTTKEHGKGTGLGLSTVFGIVKGHGGFIDVRSRVGQGTTFEIYLPAAASGQEADAEEPPGQPLPVGHGELILVVDDEEAVLEVTKMTLDANGYDVLTAHDGTEAVALYARHRDRIKAVLVDMAMPHMDGLSIMRRLQKLNPQVAIMANFSERKEDEPINLSELGVHAVLVKPYTADKLLIALAELITPGL
jgi:two-component system cell cycle sensor histidine kinase/response regulator CckA